MGNLKEPQALADTSARGKTKGLSKNPIVYYTSRLIAYVVGYQVLILGSAWLITKLVEVLQ